MTRGKLVLITKDFRIYSSYEFNGDMYWRGHGKNVYEYLKNCENLEEFNNIVIKFNDENHKYNDMGIWQPSPIEKYLDFSEKTYFEEWFSDYLYIKNANDEDIKFIDYNGEKQIFPANEVTILNFGEIYIPEKEE